MSKPAPDPIHEFYENPSPLLAVTLAIYDHNFAGKTAVSHEFVHQLHKAEDLLRDPVRAAAPELLKACKSALRLLKGREHDQFLRDAIAKAEGV